MRKDSYMEAVVQACLAAARGAKVSNGILTPCAGVRADERQAETEVVKEV